MSNTDSNCSRINTAKERGLPETATWKEIGDYDSNCSRINAAKERGLPETATWKDVNDHGRKTSVS